MADTPNMNLTLPIVGSTLGPEYAELNNEAFEEIDSHDHTSGKGVAVPTVGLNINANLPFNGFAATEVNALTLQDVSGTPADLSVYSDNGNLYYRNAAGNAVLVTDGDTIAGTVGSIAGLGDGGSSATFSDLSESFSWFYTGARLAAFNMGDIRLYPFDGLSGGGDPVHTNFITLKSPLTLSSDYSLTLPTGLPGSVTSLLQVSTSGAVSFSNTIAASLTLGSQLFGPVGSAGAPTYSFTADPDTGIYQNGANNLTFSSAGVKRLEIYTGGIETQLPVHVPNGSSADPTFSFINSKDTGLYLSADNEIAFSADGAARMTVNSSAVSVLNALTTPSINTAGGGAFKVKLVTITTSTNTINNGITASIGANHGLTYTNIRSVDIVVQRNSGVSLSFGSGSNGATLEVQGQFDNTLVYASITNSTGGPVTYANIYAVITYI